MKELDPRSGKDTFEEKAWHSNAREKMIGFINRDAELSETIANPSLINPLGTLFSSRMPNIMATTDTNAYKWSETPRFNASVPGIMTFEFTPVFGAASEYFRGGQRSIFIDKWTEFRQIYSGTENFQPGDLQAVTAQLMHLRMHLHHIYRTLRVMQTQNPSGDSKFSTVDALVKAMGWNISALTARKNYVKWHNTYNLMVSAFNKISWVKDFIPGVDRWAAMCDEIYKDTSANTDYCQLMLFRPRCYYSLTTEADSEGILTWTMSPSANYYARATDSEDVSIELFEEYLDQVYDDILGLYYDSSVQQIVSTLVQVAKLTKSEALITNFDEPFLDMSPQRIEYTWDFAVMLAIHNATLVDIDLESSVAHVNGKEGVFTQTMFVNSANNDNYSNLVNCAKLVNLPCFTPTNADVANATQWMIISDKYHGEGAELDPSAYGTEILNRAYCYFFYPVDEAGVIKPKLTYNQWYQVVSINNDGETHISTGYQDASVQLGLQFAYCPLMYNITRDGGGANCIEGVLGQTEVLYAMNYSVLSAIHDVWVSNFWGFPIHPFRTGTAQLETIDNH